MNADDQLRPLDERAATAARDLRARAAERPAPPFDPDRAVMDLPTTRPAGRGRALAVAAVVLVAAAIAGLLVARSGDDGDDKAKLISGDPRPYVVKDVPPGFSLTGAGEITADQTRLPRPEERAPSPVVLYGPSAEDPQLAIVSRPTYEPSNDDLDGSRTIDLGGGRKGYLYDGVGFGRRALVVTQGDATLLLISPTLRSEELREVAIETTVHGRLEVDFGDWEPPSGWHEVGRFADVSELGGSLTAVVNPTATGKYVAYTATGPDTGSATSSSSGVMTVTSAPGDSEHLYAGKVLADTSSTTTVRGHEAVITTSVLHIDGDQTVPTRSVTWIERPGEMVRLAGSGFDEQEMLAAAESLEPLGPAAWKDLIEQTQLGTFDTADPGAPPAITVGEGRFADGTRWRLEAVPSGDQEFSDPSVDLSVAVASSGDSATSSGSSSTGSQVGDPGANPIFSIDVERTDARTFAGALVSDTVARVQLQGPDGEVLEELEIYEAGGYRGVAVAIPTDVASLVAFAADGTVLGRDHLGLPLDAPGGDGSGGASATTVVTGGSSSGSGSSSGGSRGG